MSRHVADRAVLLGVKARQAPGGPIVKLASRARPPKHRFGRYPRRVARADEHEGVAIIEPNSGGPDSQFLDQADQADHRCGVDVAAGALVVERDIAADDRDAEYAAGIGQTVDCLRKLPHH